MPTSSWDRFKQLCSWFFCTPAYSFKVPSPPQHRPSRRESSRQEKDDVGTRLKATQHELNTVVQTEKDDSYTEDGPSYHWQHTTTRTGCETLQSAGIRFKIAQHEANAVERTGERASCAEDVLSIVWQPTTVKTDYKAMRNEYVKCKELYQSSMKETVDDFVSFIPKWNGFVHTVLQAYNQHHELVIRPDDIWIAILSQLNLYVNANAEDLRHYFVAHEGREKLTLIYDDQTRYTLDYNVAARDFSDFLRSKVIDPDLVNAILPNFSTTSNNDITICSVVMMSTLKAYFEYEIDLRCGIPAITLLGMKSDYETILTKLDKLEESGLEAKAFVALLRPIIYQFIATFDAISEGIEPNIDFWGTICHEEIMGSGSNILSGWLTAFCVWDSEGKWQGPRPADRYAEYRKAASEDGDTLHNNPSNFDASAYKEISMSDVPLGFSEVEVAVLELGKQYDCMMVAGHVGARVSGKGESQDTLQPSPQWFMFEVEKVSEEGSNKW